MKFIPLLFPGRINQKGRAQSHLLPSVTEMRVAKSALR